MDSALDYLVASCHMKGRRLLPLVAIALSGAGCVHQSAEDSKIWFLAFFFAISGLGFWIYQARRD